MQRLRPGSGRRAARTKLTRAEIDRLYSELAAVHPEPRSELKYHNPYTLLVAVVLSAQATDISVNKAMRPVFQSIRDPEAMLEFGEDNLREAIRTIGLYRNKAKNVILLSRALIDRFGGEVPGEREALESLPGVGPKTANVVMNVAFGQPTIAVDTHIFRVSNRTGLAPGKDPLAVEQNLEAMTPDRFKRNAHHWLILHGRYVCKARKPECWRCVIADVCRYRPKTPPPA